LIKRSQYRVATNSGNREHIQHFPCCPPPARDVPLALLCPAIPIVGSNPHQGCNLLPVQLAYLGHFGNQRRRSYQGHTRSTIQNLYRLCQRRLIHPIRDLSLQRGDFGVQPFQVLPNIRPGGLWGGSPVMFFYGPHLH